jgi:hypothetical protein
MVGVAIGCAGEPRDQARIVLERVPDSDGVWRAVYHLGAPAERLRFQRQAAFYRPDVWEIATPGWRFEREGDDQLLVAKDTSYAADTIEVRFPVFTEHLPKEYELFGAFSDGSVAVYTGHLYVTTRDEPPHAEDESRGEPDDAEFLRRVELVPRAGENLVVQGRVSAERLVWDDPHGDGTYVYFGGIEPLETDAMIAVVDPGAPGWLVEQMHRMLPTFFDEYTTRFGEPLPWKPVVLFGFVDVDRPGLSSGGGTLTGLIQMSATGHAWHEATPDSSEQLLYLIAHEAAHLWNGQLHAYDDSADSWMHEGSADAFAELLLRQSGAIDDARLAERRSDALNLCARGLGGGPLADSLRRSEFDNYYSCGNLIAVWSVAATGDPGDADRLYALWRTIFAGADPADGSYDRETYFAALGKTGATAERVRRLRNFIDAEHPDPVEALVELFAAVGVELGLPERPPVSGRRPYAAAVLQQLMDDACGRHSFHYEGGRLRTAPLEDCEPFSRELRVVKIEGHAIREDGDLAHAAARRRCGADGAITLGLEDGASVRVPCPDAPATLPRPLAFPVL